MFTNIIDSSTTYLGSSVSSNKRQLCGTINAIIASCCVDSNDGDSNDDERGHPNVAKHLFELYLDNTDKLSLSPDLVTYCCTYTACSTDQKYESFANDVLEKAYKVAKKLGGSKFRKSLSLSKRKKIFDETDEDRLQEALHMYDVKVLYNSNDYIGISKPSGMICYHSHLTTSGKVSRKNKKKQNNDNDNNPDFSLEDILGTILNIPLSNINVDGRGIVHRLDRSVSGCILIAKNNAAHAKLVTQFFLRNNYKSYLALVVSTTTDVIKEKEGCITLTVHGQIAKSSYEVLHTWNNNNSNSSSDSTSSTSISLVRLRAHTGRKHQIRIHCGDGLNSPILLDPLYNNNNNNNNKHEQKESHESILQTYHTNTKLNEKIVNDNKNKKMGNTICLHAESLSIRNLDIDIKDSIPNWWYDIFPPLVDYKY